jgi:hypothetical protein
MKRLSISERMRKAKSLSVRREIAVYWSSNWRADHETTLLAASRACASGDQTALVRSLGQLKALHEKGFTGLGAVIGALSDEDTI